MFDFKNLEIQDNSVWMDLYELKGRVRLKMRIASESNADYNNAKLSLSGKKPRRRGQVERDITSEDLRADARITFPKNVIVGWEGVVGTGGEEVPFTELACREFCQKLPGWIFDRIIIWSMLPENFLNDGEDVPPDSAELAKN